MSFLWFRIAVLSSQIASAQSAELAAYVQLRIEKHKYRVGDLASPPRVNAAGDVLLLTQAKHDHFVAKVERLRGDLTKLLDELEAAGC